MKLLDRANMASTKAFKDIAHSLSTMTENGQYGSPLFAKLVPYSVHVAANIYSERRDRLINYSVVEPLEGMDSQLHQYVPGYQ